jgi:hypothetical protein
MSKKPKVSTTVKSFRDVPTLMGSFPVVVVDGHEFEYRGTHEGHKLSAQMSAERLAAYVNRTEPALVQNQNDIVD